jgi:hypothetical protein
MEAWIGPAIVAAAVSGVVSALGWFVTGWQSLRLEERRRAEKVNDFQVALRAEIESELQHLAATDRKELLVSVTERMLADAGYVPFVPKLAGSPVFEALVKDIQVLPAQSISPVIRYARFRQTVERFVEDLRDTRYSVLSADRRIAMYTDYIAMLDALQVWASAAIAALTRSLAGGEISGPKHNSASDPPTPGSGADDPALASRYSERS